MSAGIRHATPADAHAVLAAYDWLFEPPGRVPSGFDPEAALARLNQAIESGRAAVLVAEDGETIVGLATVYLTYPSVRFGQRAWVEDLAVDPGRRSQGVGVRLLDSAKAWAAEQGAELLGLESADARAEAHRFYEREQPDTRSRSFGWALSP